MRRRSGKKAITILIQNRQSEEPMTENKGSKPPSPTMAKDNYVPLTKNYTPPTTSGVQSNHTPTTQQAPSPPPPSPKKK